MRRFTCSRIAAIVAFGIPLLASLSSAQQKPDVAHVAPTARAVVVQLNGRRFADAVAVANSASGEEVLVPVSALTRALDGQSVSSRRARSRSRLRLNGPQLLAVAHGGCDECPVRVMRLFVISARVRDVNGTPVVPLADLVAAFEGRLDVDSTRTLYGVHAGKCTWCILGPR